MTFKTWLFESESCELWSLWLLRQRNIENKSVTRCHITWCYVIIMVTPNGYLVSSSSWPFITKFLMILNESSFIRCRLFLHSYLVFLHLTLWWVIEKYFNRVLESMFFFQFPTNLILSRRRFSSFKTKQQNSLT